MSAPARFDRLEHGLADVREFADNHGVCLQYEVQTNEGNIEYDQDVPVFSASIGKLALAATLAHHKPRMAKDMITIFSSDVATLGNGLFDHPQADSRHLEYPLEVPGKLVIKDMLGRSSNTAFIVLAKYNAENIQKQYADLGWRNTTLIPTPGGGVELGTTTPEEALDQLQLIVEERRRKGNITAQAAVKGLKMVSDTRHGLGLYDLTDLKTLRKTGAYNGDPTDPHVYRHEVARVAAGQTGIDYAFMTQSADDSKKSWFFTNHVLNRASSEVAMYLGLKKKRFIGLRALTS